MSGGESRNLPGPLEQAEAVYRGAAARLPVTGAMIARRARHFAASARLGRDEPGAMRRLYELTGGLDDIPSLAVLLPRLLDGALSLMGADFGTVHLVDPVTGSLRLVTQSGFGSGFVEYFAVVDDDRSAGGRAARERAQVVIADVNADPGFAPHRGMAAASGFRAVQSTPLADDAGHLIGVLSAHFRRPHHPAGLDLRIMELYADIAGEAIADRLGTLDDGPGDPIGRAEGPSSREPGPAGEAASPDDTMTLFAEYIVNRLFSVGLRLDSVHSIVGQGPAGDRVAAATGEVDRLIREIRDQVFGGRGQRTQAGLPRKSRLDDQERSAPAADRAAPLQEHMARTARALQASAADYAALLERQADLARPPGRMDYPAEIKRWRAYADQAGHMAERWEQSPLPDPTADRPRDAWAAAKPTSSRACSPTNIPLAPAGQRCVWWFRVHSSLPGECRGIPPPTRPGPCGVARRSQAQHPRHDKGHQPKGRRTLGRTTFGAESDHARPLEGGVIMNTDDRWSMQVFVGEVDGETDAEVRMIKIDNRNFSGRGKAQLNPADRNVSVIGEEIAIARALSDLSHKLLHSAAVGVESMTHEKARLHG